MDYMNIQEARKRFKKIRLKEWEPTSYLDVGSHTILDTLYAYGKSFKSFPKCEIDKDESDVWEEWTEPVDYQERIEIAKEHGL